MDSVEKNLDFMPGRPPKIELLVKKYMVEKALNNTRTYEIFHPSAWGYCLRKIAYQFYNEKKQFLHLGADKIDLRVERVYDHGHEAHARWQKYLANSGILRGCWICTLCNKMYGQKEKLGIFSPLRDNPDWKCECGGHPVLGQQLTYGETAVRSEPQYNFEGHVDAIIDLRGSIYEQGNDNDVFVVDFKTIKDDHFSSLRQAKYEHCIQTQIYMWLLDLKVSVVVYEDKDNQHLKEMIVPRDDALIEKIKKEALWMVEVLLHKKLPDRPDGFTQSQFPCRFCEFRKICFS